MSCVTQFRQNNLLDNETNYQRRHFLDPGGGEGVGGGVLQISSGRDDQRIFLGFEIFDSGIFLR